MRSVLWLAALGAAGWVLPAAEAAVGRIEAEQGVTPSGGPAYRIPIEVTEGIGGMTPQLAVSYAGPSARSILGVGFALEGLPSITRCAKTIVQDGVAEAPVISSTDRYCLGGQRLRLVSGIYGATGSTYRTELDAVARITAQASGRQHPRLVPGRDPRRADPRVWQQRLLAAHAGPASVRHAARLVAQPYFRPQRQRAHDQLRHGPGESAAPAPADRLHGEQRGCRALPHLLSVPGHGSQ